MIRLAIHISVAMMFCAAAAAQKDSSEFLYLADPTIFYESGTYYLYGTVEGKANEGFIVYTSKNTKVWKTSTHTPGGAAFQKGTVFGAYGFWAPQVFKEKEKYYMAYVAEERIAIAVAAHPAGPYIQATKEPLQAPVKQIDPFVFIDSDGQKYLYHVRLDGGNKIYVAQMADDFSAIRPETLRLCITASEPWENTANAPWPVAEGPTVIKKDSLYYLFYTANDFRNPDYAVGYAVSRHPLGPWQKENSNPILSKKDVGYNGTGHGDFVAQNGNWWYVFHTHYSAQKVSPRKTAMMQGVFKKNNHAPLSFYMQPQTFRYLLQEK